MSSDTWYEERERRRKLGSDLPKPTYLRKMPWEKVHGHDYELWVQNDMREIKAWLEGRSLEPRIEEQKAEAEERKKRLEQIEKDRINSGWVSWITKDKVKAQSQEDELKKGWGDVKEVDESEEVKEE